MLERFATVSSAFFILHMAVTSIAIAPNSVTLYKDRNFGGRQCEIEVQGCKPVCPGMEAKTSSIKGNAPCVNFYRRPNCTAYMGTWHSSDGDVWDWKGYPAQDSIVSVGDCKQPIFPMNSMTFYEHKNFGGRFCNIPVSGCRPMCPELDNRASSAEGTATCVKLFDQANCRGFLRLLYLQDNANRNFADFISYQDKVTSIADCDNSTATFYQHKGFKGKSCEIPLTGCKPMCPDLDNQASSVDGNVFCVKAYSEPNCNGYLGIIWQDESTHSDFDGTDFQDKISSVSDCASKETVTFFEHKKYKGRRCDIQVKGCQPMCPELDNLASSVQGSAQCIRVYDDANCTNKFTNFTFQYHPLDSYDDFKGNDWQDKISSVSNCWYKPYQ
ncbi:unnamed protein product [Bemisia tabaci]|uniref:Uncharacterized protein n=1 Tax=Bemisia tabaci TaxID=7038 RepID=A0A9P0AFS7_BEMTA|nr:unnamed protein product [Bemisia tabaci]